MVAEAPKTADKPKKERSRPRGEVIPIYTRIKARNLYLSQGLGHRAIADATGLSIMSSQQLASREGWVAIRRQQNLSLEKQSDVRAQEAQSEVLNHIAAISEQHAIKGLENVGKALDRDQLTDEYAAKDFQSYTSGVKNLVSVIREVRRPDSELNASGNGPTFNLFFAKPEAASAQRVSIPVDTAIDVSASVVLPVETEQKVAT